jgi:hypothetical protein
MAENDAARSETQRIRRLLRTIARLAKDASLTGTLEKGAGTAARQYNQVLQHLEQTGAVPAGFFPALCEDASFDDIGVAAAQLAGYLEGDEESGRGEPPRTIGSNNVNISLGGVKDLKDLKELGQVIREHMPDWLRSRVPGRHEEAEEGGPVNATSLTEIESRLAEVGAKLQAVAEQLRRGDLSDGQRAELAEQLSRLGQEQARLARRHAMLRGAAS